MINSLFLFKDLHQVWKPTNFYVACIVEFKESFKYFQHFNYDFLAQFRAKDDLLVLKTKNQKFSALVVSDLHKLVIFTACQEIGKCKERFNKKLFVRNYFKSLKAHADNSVYGRIARSILLLRDQKPVQNSWLACANVWQGPEGFLNAPFFELNRFKDGSIGHVKSLSLY